MTASNTNHPSLRLGYLTDWQRDIVNAARRCPVILYSRDGTRVANKLERLGWGTVEDGASGERIFRLNQAGENALKGRV